MVDLADLDAVAELWPIVMGVTPMSPRAMDEGRVVPVYKPTVADTAAPDDRARGGEGDRG